ncbi:MAG: hypothetical protein EA352_03765 [Gemmatimonadales bacterium]|nr:MAG: hypothetical protein EA352_03765 [Gemmatimonadales bacterium]
MRGGRAGASLLELAVALVVAGVFTLGVAALLRAAGEATSRIVERSDDQQTVRTVWSVLEEELSAGRPGVDWWVEEPVAVGLRAFRGVGFVCGSAAELPGGGDAEEWVLLWMGQRAPVPGTDSVLVWASDGAWHLGELTGASLVEGDDGADGGLLQVLCLQGGPLPESAPRVGRFRWEGGPPAEVGRPLVVRTFVRGRYSLEDGAFRYLRGQAGRQPLTPERVGDGSRIEWLPGGRGLQVELHLESGGVTGWRHQGVHP